MVGSEAARQPFLNAVCDLNPLKNVTSDTTAFQQGYL
jgi:hypothetical protein